MYEGLYNVRKGLAPSDASAVGAMTAKLLLQWSEWQHRRVEEISFDQDDAATRDISLDFTLPNWFHEIRETHPSAPKRHLVPLTFLKKQSLINFRLRDDCDRALPLLTRWQTAQISETALIVLASTVLSEDTVPHDIRCDIRTLVGAKEGSRLGSSDELFHRPDQHSELRARLEEHDEFRSLVHTFEKNFLACSMLDISRHQRRIVHLSYEELLIRNEAIPWYSRVIPLARGRRSRKITFPIPRGSAPESSHIEVVAPDGLQIVDRRQVYKDTAGEVDDREQLPGGHQRAHFHFGQQGPLGTVTVTMIPSSVTNIRLATLASGLGLIAILVAFWATPDIRGSGNSIEVAAAILLSFTALAGLAAGSEDGGTNMVRELLWPVQVLSLAPVLWTFLAGLVVLAPLGVVVTRLCFGLLSVCALSSTVQLVFTSRIVTRPTRSGLMSLEG